MRGNHYYMIVNNGTGITMIVKNRTCIILLLHFGFLLDVVEIL